MPKTICKSALVLILAGAALAGVLGAGQSSLSNDTAARIRRVENGLLPPVPFQRQTIWSILERIKFYTIPGVSAAVFYDDKIAWAKGYGVMNMENRTLMTAET